MSSDTATMISSFKESTKKKKKKDKKKKEKKSKRKHDDDVEEREGKKKSTKRQPAAKPDDEAEEERRLTNLLFGTGNDDYSRSKKALPDDEQKEPLFEIDRIGDVEDEDNDQQQDDDDDDSQGSDGHEQAVVKESKPPPGAAWMDEDDDDPTRVDLLATARLKKLRKQANEPEARGLTGSAFESRLRHQFQSTMERTARTDWAKLKQRDDEDDDSSPPSEKDERKKKKQSTSAEEDEDLRLCASSEPLLLETTRSNQGLPPNSLDIMRYQNVNLHHMHQSVVSAIDFHPASDPETPLVLTAGLDKKLQFFSINPDSKKHHEKVQSIHFPKMPIYSASFLADSGMVVVSGRRAFFYLYDTVAGKVANEIFLRGGTNSYGNTAASTHKSLERLTVSPDGKLIAFLGNDGYIQLFDVQRQRPIAQLKLNGSVRAVAFAPRLAGQEDKFDILASGSDGDVYRFDWPSRKCISRFPNQDGTITQSLHATASHFAVGAESGVVNLYRNADDLRKSSTLEPIKSIMNLKSSVARLRFSHDGQILCMSSERDRGQNALKLLHVPTATVFSNWPTTKTPLSSVFSTAFSPQSKYLAIGNDRGQCFLYSLGHYNKRDA